jgi:hypothetical protein
MDPPDIESEWLLDIDPPDIEPEEWPLDMEPLDIEPLEPPDIESEEWLDIESLFEACAKARPAKPTLKRATQARVLR